MNIKNSILSIFFVFPCTVIANPNISMAYNYQGLYAGGFLGGASGAKIASIELLRLDNNAYWFRPFHDTYTYKTHSSFIGGGEIGYNWKIYSPSYLLGIEGEYGYLDSHGSSKDVNQTPYETLTQNTPNTSANTIKIGSKYGYGFIGGRLGYLQERLLFYVKSGAIFTSIISRYNSEKTEAPITAFLNIFGTNNITGYGLGGGVEYAVPFKELSNLSVKIEYLYLGINRVQPAYGHCTCDFLWMITNKISGINSAKIGINYKL